MHPYLLTPWWTGPAVTVDSLTGAPAIAWTLDRVHHTPYGMLWNRSILAARTYRDDDGERFTDMAEDDADRILRDLRSLHGVIYTGDRLTLRDAMDHHPLRRQSGYGIAGDCYWMRGDAWLPAEWFDDMADKYPGVDLAEVERWLPRMPVWARPYRCSVCQGLIDEVGLATIENPCQCCECGGPFLGADCPRCDDEPAFAR